MPELGQFQSWDLETGKAGNQQEMNLSQFSDSRFLSEALRDNLFGAN
jgi:hypothetical protein